ncbi:MAG: hypothetical protein JOZ37_18530 [Actinobacteria bacterium]|nr:hypothetical protein [Actinomycetota bacterium]MBV9665967.1 hypothetical protein [Actinomycetota bacterium]MBV9935997.1 hypothetical protein [Actinomycetota bacterium]
MKVAAYVPDLMDRSKLAAAAPGTNFVSNPRLLVEVEADLVVLDLSRPGVLEALSGLGHTRTIGFGSHVDVETLQAAREAGCDLVLARSAFFARLPGVLDEGPSAKMTDS